MQDRSYDRLSQGLAWSALLLVLFLPLVGVWLYGADAAVTAQASGEEVTVGIAVILRATARRLLRTGSSNLMRTTFGVFTRAVGRTATRRLVRAASRMLFGSAVKAASRPEDEDEEAPFDDTLLQRVASVLIGFVALALSFRGIMALIPPNVIHEVTYEGRIGIAEASLLAGAPLAAYAVLHAVFGRVWNVRVRYRTEIDGLLLQAYFTGSGSFLPLSTDIEYQGDPSDRQRVASAALAGLFALHLLLGALGRSSGLAVLEFSSAMMLVYCFVFCFPIQPLDGHYVWARSKLLWVAVALPILLAFLAWLPSSFGEIL